MHSVLNEGSFMDALANIASGAAETVRRDREKNKSTYMYGSISKYTQKLVLSFPTICDNTIPLSTSQMISKAHEKNLVSMFEMLFTSMSLSGTNGIEILKALHHNLNDTASIDDIIDAIEKAVGESTIPYSKAELRGIVTEMCDYLKYHQKSLPVDSFSEKSLNDYLVRESYSGTFVTENQNKTHTQKDVDDAYRRGQKDSEDSYAGQKAERDRRDYEGETISAKEKQRQKEREEDIKRRESERAEDAAARKEERSEDYKHKQDEIERKESERREDIKRKDEELAIRLAQSRVKDIDYKKSNELQPTLMTVVYNVLSPDGKTVTNDKKAFVAGIKSRMVGSDAMEIVERLSATAKNKLTFKDIIRATTGEISLVRDFIAATKQAKINAKNAAKRGETAKMWNLLSVRAKKNKVTGTGMRSNEAACITTLIINQETVNYLANQYKINLDSPKVAAEIMDSFNLLALVIADEANEVAKFLYDGNNSFELIAYSSLSKDQRDDKNYNKAINLINKTGR